MKAVLASKNPHKLVEIQAILGKLGMEVILQSELGIDIDVEETGTTFEENSLLKAEAVMQASGLPSLADDSGIAVDALDGAPGIYSARYGNKNSDEERTAFLLENMQGVPDDQRAARFVCVITCVWPDGRKIVARGECHGVLTHEVRGEGGFGYDPVFYVPELGKTLAEIPAEHKNAISHRAKALQEFCRIYREGNYDDK
ncbi:MAG: XTP/dITP diphosphatase [Oscillospiraceae bacterium]|nr:XTP/dITP diphosphatase [Oscillospiraceae bacterium]